MADKLALREATIDDLALLEHWDKQPHVIESDPNDDWNWEIELLRTPSWRRQLIAEVDGRAIGFVQIIDPFHEETHYWRDVDKNLRAIDIWIGEADDLGKGHGKKMMTEALQLCFKDPEVEAVIIDPLKSNERAIQFYQKLGFRLVEDRCFGEDECSVHRLLRSDWLKSRSK